MAVTALLMVTSVSLLHPEKAELPIVLTPSGILISLRLLQELNADWPIEVRLFGNDISTNEEQLLKA
jgi:hypothetical protein